MNHAPKSLRDIVGQPPVRHLQRFAELARQRLADSQCFLLVGPRGTGKTASAHALATELGCSDDDVFSSKWRVPGAKLTLSLAEELFDRYLRRCSSSATGFKCLIIEEFERLSPQCMGLMKDNLDPLGNMPQKLCVVATSNNTRGLDDALLDRFKVMPYSNGQAFMVACQARLKHLWAMANPGEGMPMGWTGWGRSFETEGFSMRSALQSLDEALAERELCAA